MDSSITHIRPRFRIETTHTRESVTTKVNELLLKHRASLKGQLVDNHIILDIVEKDVHFWSPQLNFRIREEEEMEGKIVLAGLIGPRPKVWTMFMFIYFSVGIIGFIISSYGLSMMMLGKESLLVWAFPVAILFMLTAYAAGKEGEKLGKEQVELLKNFIRELIDTSVN